MAFDILDVIELGSKGVVDVDDDDLPVGLLLVEQGHDAEDLDLLDLAGVADELADLADVERVVVSLGLGLGVDDIGVFPGLFRVVLAYLSLTPPPPPFLLPLLLLPLPLLSSSGPQLSHHPDWRQQASVEQP